MIKVHEADGIEPPETAFSPDPFPEAPFYLEAFHLLSTERQLGSMGGAGPIPWSAAMLYVDSVGLIQADERERFWRVIAAMDRSYLSWLAEKQKITLDKPSR